MTAGRCDCGHMRWRHECGRRCLARLCACRFYREPAPNPSPAEQAEIERFGIFAEEAGR